MDLLLRTRLNDEDEEDDEPKEKDKEKKKRMSEMWQEKWIESRTILIFGGINQALAKTVCEQLLVLSAMSDADIKVIINSQGGHVEAGDTIHDMLRFVTPKVKILGTGWVASAGALIFAALPLENRYSLPNTRFMLHQPSGGVGGQATDISIEAQEILKMRERLNLLFSKQTGQPMEKIERDTDRNYWMSAEEAKSYGLVGHLISKQDQF
jgi:ATP-dependent Clp protease protease subunit